MPAKIINLVGKRFNRLVVLSECGRDVDGSVLWLCKCDCGNTAKFRGRQLRKNEVVSCGCYRIENSRNYNTYKVEGEITYLFDVKGNKTLIDTHMLDALKPYYWFKKGEYFITVTKHKHNPISLHKFIFAKNSDLDIDHINRNKTDNRLCNLRLATRSQNIINRNCCKTNSSSYTGVSKMKSGKYRAYIGVNNKHIHLGVFDSPVAAYEKRLEAEKKYYGDFSSQGGDAIYE